MRRERAIRVVTLVAVACAALMLSACGSWFGMLFSGARDTWTRTYPLTANGTVDITNLDGPIDVRGVDGDKVEVVADRTVQAASGSLAKQVLSGLSMKEDTDPSHVHITAENATGASLRDVRINIAFHVKVPKGATVRIQTSNGRLTLVGLAGRVTAETNNGRIMGQNMSGGVTARTTNGSIQVAFSRIGTDDSRLQTINGGIHVAVPPTSAVDLSAACESGRILISDLPVQLDVKAPHRFEGRLNNGGTLLIMRTVNGGIQVTPAS